LKTDIEIIRDAGKKLYALNGVFYRQNKEAEKFGYRNYSRNVGLIAQEVQEQLPEIIQSAPFDVDHNENSKSGDNYLTVQYEKLVPLILETIKEHQEEIDEITRILSK
jgi:hypothetical protein